MSCPESIVDKTNTAKTRRTGHVSDTGSYCYTIGIVYIVISKASCKPSAILMALIGITKSNIKFELVISYHTKIFKNDFITPKFNKIKHYIQQHNLAIANI